MSKIIIFYLLLLNISVAYSDTIKQETLGNKSPAIINPKGDIIINYNNAKKIKEQNPGVEIHITSHYRKRFRFSLVSNEGTRWIINRLYLKYLSEFKWKRSPPSIEALMFSRNYGIVLSRLYSEYDLLPLTPDNEEYGYEYNGMDADHFGIELYDYRID